jgi:toxin-antitoxin system PIN domain toxin
MLVDANLLLYAVDESSSWHARAKTWLEDVLNGPRRVGLPWPSLVAFVRIATHPRATERPLTGESAWNVVADWLACDNAWTPQPTPRHARVLGDLISGHDLRGNLIVDGHLAALAIEHGLQVCSADSDFARFNEINWLNPLA